MSFWERLRVHEGEIVGNGIHWGAGPYSRLAIYLCVGRFGLRVRWKPDSLWPDFLFRRTNTYIGAGIAFDFPTRSLKLNGVSISLEILDFMTDPNPKAWYRYERHGDTVRVEMKLEDKRAL